MILKKKKKKVRVTSIATAFGPPNFQMEITPLLYRAAPLETKF